MSKYIVYSLNTNNNQLDIISIEEDEKIAKNIQNNHSFNLLCDLNKNKSLYKLEIKNNIIQIIEINIDIKNGWISNTITEKKHSVYEIGIINYFKNFKKDNLPLPLPLDNINESYIPIESNKVIPRVSSGIISNIKCTPRLVNKDESKKIADSKPNLSMLLLEELKRKCKVKE
jgi:hypothetical protein